MTQGQWLRATGTNPSLHRDLEDADRLPVEQVTWFAAAEELHRIGLRLPKEDEWEHAARAGTSTLFPWGNDPADFARYANVRDRDLQDLVQRNDPFEPARDGYALVAPVGSYPPNAWGLHDWCGNVHEWCEDPFLGSADIPKPELEEQNARIFRGGSFQRVLEEAHPGRRGGESPAYPYRAVGVRPAAELAHVPSK
jgi:formylglycine-generating enzyme required for sulfatase activity